MRFTGSSSLVDVKCKPFAAPKVTRNLSMEQDSAGRWLPCDRGQAGDAWEATVTVFGVKAEMEAFASWLDTQGRGTFTVSAVQGVVFAPLMFQESSFTACIKDLERLKRVFWASPTNGVDEVSFTLRAITPTFYDVTASLASLRLKPQDERDASWNVSHLFTETGGVISQDRGGRAGRYVGRFVQRLDEARAILRYLVDGPGRTSAFAFPNIGVQYPFGVARGDYTTKTCRVLGFEIERKSLGLWEFEIELVEETL